MTSSLQSAISSLSPVWTHTTDIIAARGEGAML